MKPYNLDILRLYFFAFFVDSAAHEPPPVPPAAGRLPPTCRLTLTFSLHLVLHTIARELFAGVMATARKSCAADTAPSAARVVLLILRVVNPKMGGVVHYCPYDTLNTSDYSEKSQNYGPTCYCYVLLSLCLLSGSLDILVCCI